jgi:hypothetical protein
MKKIFLFFSLLISISNVAMSQININNDSLDKKPPAPKGRNMFGQGIPRGVTITSDSLADGYIMFAVPNSASIYLINRKGEVVHEWKGNFAADDPYLQSDGSLFQMAQDLDFPVFAAGGEAGRIQKISWDNKMLWDFEYANEKSHAHHDITVMPNGHILALAWEVSTAKEVLAAGRKPSLIPKAGLWSEKIVEIVPEGQRGGKIVWEWHLRDHLIQYYDSKKANYGRPADHVELLNFNVGDSLPAPISQDSMDILQAQGRVWRNETTENRGSDAYHFNAIKYNPELNQIAFSSYKLSEIYIIDHSTTTKEAAGHIGGRWGKGGDFLYRWGNPQNYHRGKSTNRKFFHQHDIKWIEKGKPGADHLLVYNNDIHNRDSMNYSAVHEFIPPTDAKGAYLIEKGKPFGPDKPVWTYNAPDSVSFWSSFISGAHRMSNGNTFITEGAKGRLFEVNKEGQIVWEYLIPYRGEIRKPNGDLFPAVPVTFSVFRSTFIPANHPAFANRKLVPLNPQPKVFVLPPPTVEEK